MKRFHELTLHQREQAVGYALSELKAHIRDGIITLKDCREVTLKEYATYAAEDAYYSEPQDRVIDDIVVE